jgi:ATP-dependent protease HslVU (ClpYQ) peptidase subunit
MLLRHAGSTASALAARRDAHNVGPLRCTAAIACRMCTCAAPVDIHRESSGSFMTTLVVVRKGDEIANAADSLTTFGDTRLAAVHDRTYDKIVHYRDTYIGLCGSAAHQLVFESLLRRHEDLDFSNKFAIFETFRKLHPILKEQHFLNPKEEEDDPYESTQITALIANPHGIFGVYSMREETDTQFWRQIGPRVCDRRHVFLYA